MKISPNRLRTWAAMAAILVVYCVLVSRTERPDAFGIFHDDSMYFSSAKALVDGGGYTVPSLPGVGAAPKFPVLYPWLLSWVWRADPHFPENLRAAMDLTKFFGCWTLVAVFLLLRRLPEIGENLALLLTVVCAVHPFFIFWSGMVLSDIPFMALLLTAGLLADVALRLRRNDALLVLAAFAAACAVSLRTVGVALVAGILLAAALKRAYRAAAVFASAWVLLFVAINSPTFFHRETPAAQLAVAAPFEFGWRRALIDDTSYAALWRLCVPNVTAFFHLLGANFFSVLVAPGRLLLAPMEELIPPLFFYLMLAVSAAMIAGLVRNGRRHGWTPLHLTAPLYFAIALAWPYPQVDRFALAFFPWFLAGLAIEMKRIAGVLRRNFIGGRAADRIFALGLSAVLLALGGYAAWAFAWGLRTGIGLINNDRASTIAGKQEAYAWIREHTDAQARFAAYEDVLLYLYTGRRSVRPVFVPVFDYAHAPEILREELAHIADAPHVAGAEYWMTSSDDFSLENAREEIERRLGQMEAVLPLVFRSRDGKVSIYDARCVASPEEASCHASAPVLFPALR